MFRKFITILMIVLSLLGCSAGASVPIINAMAEQYNGHDVGVVYVNNEIVLRFYSKGIYWSPYVRAKVVADMLAEIGNNGIDLSSIKVLNGTTALVAIVGNREVFRVYEDDVKYNNSTAESLISDWAKNIRDAVTIGKVDYSSEKKLLSEEVTTGNVARPQALVNTTPVLVDTGKSAISRKHHFSDSIKSIIVSNNHFVPNFGKFFMKIDYSIVIIILTSAGGFLLSIAGISMFLKKKRLMSEDEGIASRASSEELENLVSHLISELEEKSDRITHEFQEKTDYLVSLLSQIDQKIISLEALKQEGSLPESEKPAKQIDKKQPLKKKLVVVEEDDDDDELNEQNNAVLPTFAQIDKQHRTKQEIIYELSDNGKSITEIAKKLGIGVGEVKLILDLKQ
ncbi:MAG: hypothetical protein DKM50_10160 [Candidatus Margulisiibacteriota bacterium]|nr:MAG: hypothetical protein A2X43_04245 [Candidatus Margulisbacteria bacterium GWD2_39_127]OGI05210.1 MAG: hypothetical protein A2X42_02755 [Candidatus Margulisbacteria bacterium GWF2_38_17]OGI06259.1 MAG: hypothetical protein A2X41_08335 [Candidatus Margulisbacteria bacterium GWE2_39_32]PZM78915.1 MAG: hypothetical protein DKM50_10160 [Candidatus Margulisiibacteriota bacterium]HAR64501.1 hypothetical protein [Candidatus Margulisiibacteriota bacterium]